jgi:hypothetical protein
MRKAALAISNTLAAGITLRHSNFVLTTTSSEGVECYFLSHNPKGVFVAMPLAHQCYFF